MTRLHIVTYADRCQHHFPAFLQSCERHGLTPTVLGWGKLYRGLGAKPKAVYYHLRQHAQPTDIVLFTDALDSFVVAGERELLRRFRSFRHPFVMSSETNCAPDPHLAERYPPCATPFRYLNSGSYMAEVGPLLALLEGWQVWRLLDQVNDQLWYTERYLEQPGAIHLDTNCVLFQTLYRAQQHLTCRGQIFNKLTRTYPAVLHGNGRSPMRQVLDWAGLEPWPWRNCIQP